MFLFFGWAAPREKNWLLDVFVGAGVNTILLQAGTILNHWTFRCFWNHGMGNQLDGMGNQVDGMGNQVDGMGNQLAGMGNQLDGMGNQVDEMGNQVDGMGNQVDGMGNQVDGMGNQVDGMGNQVDGMGNQVDGMGNQLDGMGNQVDGMGNQVDGMGNQLDGMGNQLDGMGNQLDGMGNQLDGMGNQLDGMGNQLDENDFFGVPFWAFCSLSLLGGWSCLVQLVLEQGKVFALYACGVVLLQRHFCWPHRYSWYGHVFGDIVFAVQSPEVEVCILLFFESWHKSTAQKWHVSLPTFRKVLSFFPSIRKVDYVKGWSNGKSLPFLHLNLLTFFQRFTWGWSKKNAGTGCTSEGW